MNLNYSDYIIREMKFDDLDAVTALEESSFSMPWKRHDFEEVLTNPIRAYLVAEANGSIIGGCMLTNIAGEGDISNVAVAAEYRNNHIASALMNKLLELGSSRYGITAFTLEVRSQNAAAIKLYSNLGFKSAGVRPDFYEKPKDDALIMWKINN